MNSSLSARVIIAFCVVQPAILLAIRLDMEVSAVITGVVCCLYPFADPITFGKFLKSAPAEKRSARKLTAIALLLLGCGLSLIVIADRFNWSRTAFGLLAAFCYLHLVGDVFARLTRTVVGLRRIRRDGSNTTAEVRAL